jgi:hypothetical protein
MLLSLAMPTTRPRLPSKVMSDMKVPYQLAGFFVRRSILQITEVFNTTDNYRFVKPAGLAD